MNKLNKILLNQFIQFKGHQQSEKKNKKKKKNKIKSHPWIGPPIVCKHILNMPNYVYDLNNWYIILPIPATLIQTFSKFFQFWMVGHYMRLRHLSEYFFRILWISQISFKNWWYCTMLWNENTKKQADYTESSVNHQV